MKLGFTTEELARLTDNEIALLAQWLSRVDLLTVYLWAAGPTCIVVVLRGDAALVNRVAFAAVLSVVLYSGLALTALLRARWGSPEWRLGRTARRLLRASQSSAGYTTRRRELLGKRAVRRDLEKSTGYRLTITDASGEDFKARVRDVMLNQVQGAYLGEGRDGAGRGSIPWATALPALAAIATAITTIVKSVWS